MKIFIFVRKGCCLCETLKNKLTKINLKEIKPKLEINEIDIDRFDLYQVVVHMDTRLLQDMALGEVDGWPLED